MVSQLGSWVTDSTSLHRRGRMMTLEMQHGMQNAESWSETRCWSVSASVGHQVQHRIAGNAADWRRTHSDKTIDAETGGGRERLFETRSLECLIVVT